MSENDAQQQGSIETIQGETCPVCLQKTLTLLEEEREIPYFGQVYLFSMTCQDKECGFHKSDLEPANPKDPSVLTFEVSGDEDLNVRVVKSASATVKIPRIVTMESDETSDGFITNIEGLFNRVKNILETIRDSSDDASEVKQAKNHLKKITRILWGKDSIKITIEDPTGCSAIISDKTEVKPLKTKKKK